MSGLVALPIAPGVLGEIDRIQPCNKCNHGSHLDRDHILGIRVPTYQVVDCPICGQASIRTRPFVAPLIHTKGG